MLLCLQYRGMLRIVCVIKRLLWGVVSCAKNSWPLECREKLLLFYDKSFFLYIFLNLQQFLKSPGCQWNSFSYPKKNLQYNRFWPGISASSLSYHRNICFYKYFYVNFSYVTFLVPWQFKRNTRLTVRSHHFTVEIATCNRKFLHSHFNLVERIFLLSCQLGFSKI